MITQDYSQVDDVFRPGSGQPLANGPAVIADVGSLRDLPPSRVTSSHGGGILKAEIQGCRGRDGIAQLLDPEVAVERSGSLFLQVPKFGPSELAPDGVDMRAGDKGRYETPGTARPQVAGRCGDRL
jgi:hypothetical protein